MTHSIETLGPLLLEGSLHETIWGGHRLHAVAGKALPDGAMVGESWETAVESVVRNRPHAGRSLGDLVQEFGADLVGSRAVEIFGQRFPLLTKYIDAHDRLSVQVHPNDEYAATHENGKLGKTETWYVLQVEPGAHLVYGLAREASPDEVRSAIEDTRLEEMLHTFEAHAGDVIYVPAGTIHAIGAGVVLYELQEYSDVTYRLYDYGRLQADGKPRELHVEKGLAVMHYTPAPVERVTPVEREFPGPAGSRRVLVGSRYFMLDELRFSGSASGTTDGSSCHIVSVLAGSCDVESAAGSVPLGLGDTVVLPAALGTYQLSATDAHLLRSTVPVEADADLLAWRAAQGVRFAE